MNTESQYIVTFRQTISVTSRFELKTCRGCSSSNLDTHVSKPKCFTTETKYPRSQTLNTPRQKPRSQIRCVLRLATVNSVKHTQRRRKECSALGPRAPRALIGRAWYNKPGAPGSRNGRRRTRRGGGRETRNRVQQRPRPREAVRSGEALGRWMWLKSHVWPTAPGPPHPPHPTQAEGVQRKRPESADRAKAWYNKPGAPGSRNGRRRGTRLARVGGSRARRFVHLVCLAEQPGLDAFIEHTASLGRGSCCILFLASLSLSSACSAPAVS